MRDAPKMKSNFKVQKRPKWTWKVVESFGQSGGGMNGGIFKVQAEGDVYHDRYFIEKRFSMRRVEGEPPPEWAAKEIQLMYQLKDHDGVVKIVDHFVDESLTKASVYMEYCELGDLGGVIKGVKESGPVNEHKIWKWFIDLMDTLVYMHRGPNPENNNDVMKHWNIIHHLDIKPQNIFLTKDKDKGEIIVKLADFGGSVSATWNFQTKTRKEVRRSDVQSQGWDAPEAPNCSAATDVWQIALSIACVCVPNMNPRSGLNPNGVPWDKFQPAGRNYSQELNSVLIWCLTDDERQRPGAMEISKRAKEMYSQIKYHLRADDNPMYVATGGSKGAKRPQAPWPGLSLGPRAADRHRPGLQEHTLSDPGVQRRGLGNNQYGPFVQNQQAPMSPRANDEGIRNGGGTPQYGGLPRGFIPGHSPHEFGGGYFGRGGGWYRRL
ncbi:kinase-like protein [Setomelanomma holmii]|uniref:non-specific serine/threonine protein kinase n=1 Tax=Setomelanomma holmii TaxID=210430 RepID=A0A9P4LQA2_9PLEO|nr:kinase-like protein [Setomelanomma holmii]